MLPTDIENPMDHPEIVQAAKTWIKKLLNEDFTYATDSADRWYCGASAYGFDIASDDDAHFFDHLIDSLVWYNGEMNRLLENRTEDIVDAYIEWREY
jgi:hypothetical protein